MKKNKLFTIVCCLAAVAGPLCEPMSILEDSSSLIMTAEAATIQGNRTYENVLVDDELYRIRSACGYFIGGDFSNVELVNRNDATAIWVARYNEEYDYWYFISLLHPRLVMNAYATRPVSKTNINLYSYVANDRSQGFLPVKQKDGSFKILNAMNNSVAVEVSGYAKDAKKGTNIRLYTSNSDKTQKFYFERVC